MSDAGLRPPPANSAPDPPRPPANARKQKWWSPLTTKSGILGLLIFIGLAISFTETTYRRLFSSEPVRDRVTELQQRQAELGKLDAAALGQRLLAELAALPGDDPRRNCNNAFFLAAEYDTKWQQENNAREAKVSEFQIKELKAKRDAALQDFSHNVTPAQAQPAPDNHEILNALRASIDALDGGVVHTFAQKFSDRILKDSDEVARMPALKREIEEQFQRAAQPSAAAARAMIEDAILKRAAAYRLADEKRRKFPSEKPDIARDQRQKEAGMRLASIASLSREEAVKMILENIADATRNAFEASVRQVLARAPGR